MDRQRRRTLQAVGLTLAGGLAGCSGGSETDSGESTTDTETEAEAEDGTETPTEMAETPTETEGETETPTDTPAETTTAEPTPTPSATYSLVINNVGASAWEVVSDESGSVAPTGTENPTMTFEVGARYEVENRGRQFHPFALRAADDSPLLTQQGEGGFEDDPAVDWVDDGELLAFTVTEDLAAALDYYICTVHASMGGDVETA